MTIQSIQDFALSSAGHAKLKKVKVIAFDFDGVFTNNKVWVSESGKESVVCSRADGIGLSRLRQIDLKPVIISSESNRVVEKRAVKLGVECFYGVEDKLSVALDFLNKHQLSLTELAFVCNDVNDIPLANKASVSIGVKDSWPEIFDYCDAITLKNGGDGAVREICDCLFKVCES